MVDISLPGHVVTVRRDGKREVVLHRSVARVGDTKIEIKSARSTVVLPIVGLALSGLAMAWIGISAGSPPLWLLVVVLLVLLFVVPMSVMGLVSAVAGADVIIDAKKGSATWQQGYLGMGIGTKELVPFAKIERIEVMVEGGEGDRWKGASDDLRQFALWLEKKSGKRLKIAQVPVPAYGQEDGMDRVLAVGQAIGQLTGAPVAIPEGWELVEVDAETLEAVNPPVSSAGGAGARSGGSTAQRKRRRRR